MRLALIGADGMLAQAVKKIAPAEYEIVPFDLPEFDITNRVQVLTVLGELRPSVIVNCAAFTNVDGCETQEATATLVNGEGPRHLAEAANAVGATLAHLSTDYVFDGEKRQPYVEDDPVAPQSAYGRSKLAGERAILDSGLERFFIVRTSWLYGPGGKNFVETIARLAAEREELRIVADQVGSPTYTFDLATAIFRLLALADPQSPVPSPRFSGIYHFSNAGVCSWHEFSVEIAAQLKAAGAQVRAERILPIRSEEYPLPAKRPAYSVLSKEKYKAATGAEVPEWREGLARFFQRQ